MLLVRLRCTVIGHVGNILIYQELQFRNLQKYWERNRNHTTHEQRKNSTRNGTTHEQRKNRSYAMLNQTCRFCIFLFVPFSRLLADMACLSLILICFSCW